MLQNIECAYSRLHKLPELIKPAVLCKNTAMEKITHQNLHPLLSKSLTDTDFVLILNALIKFLRRGGKKQAAER
ncbi:MAG: recombinase, partial [Neisseria sp.]